MAKILVIDDDTQVLASLGRVLERAGHEVVETTDAVRAVTLATQGSCDLVITDINMPGMDGIEVIIALSEKMPGLPVIAISGGGKVPKELLLVSANLLGAVTTLSKPFEVAELIAAVELALASRRREGDSTG